MALRDSIALPGICASQEDIVRAIDQLIDAVDDIEAGEIDIDNLPCEVTSVAYVQHNGGQPRLVYIYPNTGINDQCLSVNLGGGGGTDVDTYPNIVAGTVATADADTFTLENLTTVFGDDQESPITVLNYYSETLVAGDPKMAIQHQTTGEWYPLSVKDTDTTGGGGGGDVVSVGATVYGTLNGTLRSSDASVQITVTKSNASGVSIGDTLTVNNIIDYHFMELNPSWEAEFGTKYLFVGVEGCHCRATYFDEWGLDLVQAPLIPT